ncbi:MAG: hypothetical protein ABSD75_17130 [Terriglobales bacterium]|jgi:hypothetical protein
MAPPRSTALLRASLRYGGAREVGEGWKTVYAADSGWLTSVSKTVTWVTGKIGQKVAIFIATSAQMERLTAAVTEMLNSGNQAKETGAY